MGFSTAMDGLAWRGLVYTVFILHFVFACQLLLLQPLVSAIGLQFSLFDLFARTCILYESACSLIYFRCFNFFWIYNFHVNCGSFGFGYRKINGWSSSPHPKEIVLFFVLLLFLILLFWSKFFTEQCPVKSIPACFCPCSKPQIVVTFTAKRRPEMRILGS